MVQTTSPAHEVVMAYQALRSAPRLLLPTGAALPFSLFDTPHGLLPQGLTLALHPKTSEHLQHLLPHLL